MLRPLALFAALMLATAPAMAEGPMQIFLAHAQKQTPESDTSAAVADEFRRQVGERSAGRMRVEVLADGITGGNRDTTALVEKGIIHSALVTLGGVTPVHAPLDVLNVPFAFKSLDHARAVLDGPFGRRLADDMAATTRLALLGFAAPNGFHILTNSDRPVGSPDEMWGLRLRAIPGSKPLEAMIRAVGAVPVKVSSREELAALATGGVDGQMNPAPVVLARGFDGVQRYATLTNHLYVPYAWIFNKAALAAMPAEDAAIVHAAATVALQKGFALARELQNSERGLAGLARRLEVRDLSPDERAEFEAAMRPPVEKAIVGGMGDRGGEWMAAFKDALNAPAP